MSKSNHSKNIAMIYGTVKVFSKTVNDWVYLRQRI
jgi:hypothetical protein